MLLLEHININVGDGGLTERFHRALGCQQSQNQPHMQIHMNCGPHTQFHMPIDSLAQVWRGDLVVAYTTEGLVAARRRLEALAAVEANRTRVVCKEGEAEVLVQDPWGNRFRLREGTEAEKAMAALPTRRPNTSESVDLGVIGLVELFLPVAPGKAAGLARFYEEVFGFETSAVSRGFSILGGPVRGAQHITFVEQDAVPEHTGEHFCMYIGDFEGVCSRCEARGLLYVNPRFPAADSAATLEQARLSQGFRILEVHDAGEGQEGGEGGTQQLLLCEEHEIRSASHEKLPLL